MKTREERQALRASMPRTPLSAHHMENARLLPDRGELLYRIPNGGIGVEVGAAFGEYTAEILEKNRPAQLYLIDPWSMDRYSSGLDSIHANFAAEIEAGRLHLMQGTSLEKLAEFEDDFLDWAYIDTDHSFELTWQELLLCEKKVKRTGRIAGHDFCTGNTVKPIVYGVVEAVTKFCKDYGWQFEFLTVESHAHFSYCLKRL
ncbi:class I SAM-dependent methyltransferase [Rhizobium johnstonii]|uniref:class I SAM-dependent methyltransferase n=1 Tax=Rhizobium TaxID=379 RepID=UPI0010325994|nr:class I SAM-dependent methyltransferase [Rhizobium leguminosarum]TBF81975.1 class I SAM-dependent methyltransferase [Rhizobium leguminosarum]TBF98539.1 class I SAM-dependent methyltransferase [Rhizobium leguminosarum]TBG67686.1 class I SAM-dependent methyltransferase [Rhizobium leguminosarum]TBH01465.1 class I SAM-dependent methyltransferase [Rhizobium leguminosarum]TBH11003.1 class I SAM-dependent methyltransferase [Rhizobium leguminosarum]